MLIHPWTVGLLSKCPSGSCEQRCYGRWCVHTCLSHYIRSSGCITRSEIVGSYGDSVFDFLRNWHIVIVLCHWLYYFTFSPAVLKSFNFSVLHLHLLFSVFFIIAIVIFVKWYFVVLICIFPVINDSEYLLMCVLPFVYLWRNIHLLIGLFSFVTVL